MGMTIEEAKEHLSQYIGDNRVDYDDLDAIGVAVDTMRKYQKIEQIYHMFNEVNDFPLAMWNIGGVLDGNGVSEVRI